MVSSLPSLQSLMWLQSDETGTHCMPSAHLNSPALQGAGVVVGPRNNQQNIYSL